MAATLQELRLQALSSWAFFGPPEAVMPRGGRGGVSASGANFGSRPHEAVRVLAARQAPPKDERPHAGGITKSSIRLTYGVLPSYKVAEPL